MDVEKLLAFAMHNDDSRLALISNNIANISTPGYKHQSELPPKFSVQFDASLSPSASLEIDSIGKAKTFLSTKSGSMHATGSLQDFYVTGNGFVEVGAPAGISYVRQAALRIDSQGRLVNQDNLPVHTLSGEINLPAKPFSLTAHGDIVQDGEIVGRLKLVEPSNIFSMTPSGNGTYRFVGEMRQIDNGQLKIGFSEGSNVETSQEMIDLLETVRHFESLQKIAQAYGELHDKAARYLGEF